MNNKGFTLIELLSVVILLSILIFLVLPNIVNSVKNKTEDTNELTFDIIKEAVKLHIEDNKKFYKKIDGNKYCIRVNKLVNNNYLNGRIEYDGEDITDTKSIQVTYDRGFSFELLDNSSCTGDIIGCTVVKGDGTKTGDEIECGGEYFYVIENDGASISMLAKYNLNIGTNLYTEGVVGIQNENVVGFKSEMTNYGTTSFSSTNYWLNGGYIPHGDSDYNFVYDKNSNLYEYLNQYEKYLETKGIYSANATLISYEQLEKLGCDNLSSSCKTSEYAWIYYTSYWSGSAIDDTSVLRVKSGNLFSKIEYNNNNQCGVRPVINISGNEI